MPSLNGLSLAGAHVLSKLPGLFGVRLFFLGNSLRFFCGAGVLAGGFSSLSIVSGFGAGGGKGLLRGSFLFLQASHMLLRFLQPRDVTVIDLQLPRGAAGRDEGLQ